MDNNLDIMRPIIGLKTIAKYTGYNKDWFCKNYSQIMQEKGYLWKRGNFVTSPVCTTPFLLNLFFTEYNYQNEIMIKRNKKFSKQKSNDQISYNKRKNDGLNSNTEEKKNRRIE